MSYLENKDTSTISYKRFNQSPLDEYPTFSICLKGPELYWKHEKMIFSRFGATSAQYIQILEGGGSKHDYNETSGLYENVLIGTENLSTTDLHQFSLNPISVITGVDFVTQQDNHSEHYGTGSEGTKLFNIPFHVGYQAPDEVCFTRNSSFISELTRVHDLISLDRSLLDPGNHLHLDFRIIIHYPGQLLRSVRKPSFRSKLSSYTKNKILELKVSHVTTLRKRKDSNIPCNEKIKSDDAQILKVILKRVGCIPVYWKPLISTYNDLEVCNSSSQLKMAHQYTQHFEDIMSSYDPPCIEMTSVVKSTRDLEQREQQFQISIQYVQSFYQEIENKKAYHFEFYFSSVGGFIGVCVGTSMMEIPKAFEHVKSRARQIKSPVVIGKIFLAIQATLKTYDLKQLRCN